MGPYTVNTKFNVFYSMLTNFSGSLAGQKTLPNLLRDPETTARNTNNWIYVAVKVSLSLYTICLSI